MQIFHQSDAVGAAHHVLRKLQPDWQPGMPLSDEVDQVLQALCLRPYVGHEKVSAGGRDKVHPMRRYCELEQDIDKVPTYEIAMGKFS